jgi:hypothetical protein
MKFIAVHPLQSPITKDQITEAARACRAENSNDAYWVDSWTQLNDKGEITVIYCQYDAKDANSISNLLKKGAPDLPVEGIYPMGKLDSEDYR